MYNSFDQNKAARDRLRSKLCPSFGQLYPDCHTMLINSENYQQLREAVVASDMCSLILDKAPDPQAENHEESKTLEDLIFQKEVDLNTLVFDEQCNFAAFYSYVKLKEQEIRNIVWMAEMIARNIPKENPLWNKLIIPFSDKE